MAQENGRCDSNRLRHLLEDTLPPPTQAEVLQHLDVCAECQRAVERLAAEQLWWDELRQLSGLDDGKATREYPPTAPALAHKDARGAGAGQSRPRLDFLAAADDPTHLGRLDRFAVTEFLGSGGMGMVLKAFDSSLNRPVAIKVLAPHFASSGAARRRFAREAQAAATVVHPHVVAIHSVDSWEGLPYLVMAYVAGRSLQERLDTEGPLDVKEILRIGMQTASGLAAAHAQGLVHRDVKPANILLEHGAGRVLLTDFGLARAVDDASLTQSGVIAGTPQYMSPEQALGSNVDHRADLFSLGSTLYAMATGHAPFRAESAMAVLRRVCDDQPRPLREVNADIPLWLTAIIEKLHAKEPAQRWQTAAEVADLLGKCLAHLQQPDAIPLPKEVAGLSSPATSKRNRARWLTAAIVLVLALGPLAAVRWTPREDAGGPERQPGLNAADPPRRNVDVLDPGLEVGALDLQFEKLRARTSALEADLKQSKLRGYGDPADAMIQEVKRGLDQLEYELNAMGPPGKR